MSSNETLTYVPDQKNMLRSADQIVDLRGLSKSVSLTLPSGFAGGYIMGDFHYPLETFAFHMDVAADTIGFNPASGSDHFIHALKPRDFEASGVRMKPTSDEKVSFLAFEMIGTMKPVSEEGTTYSLSKLTTMLAVNLGRYADETETVFVSFFSELGLEMQISAAKQKRNMYILKPDNSKSYMNLERHEQETNTRLSMKDISNIVSFTNDIYFRLVLTTAEALKEN